MSDIKQKRAATRCFSKYFSQWLLLRQSVQHRAELFGTPEALNENVGIQPYPINQIMHRAIVTNFKKQRVAVAFTHETLLQLQEVRDLYWGIFL